LIYFLYIYEYGTLKLVKVILSKRIGKRESNGGDESNQSTVYVYVEISQQNPCMIIIW
jgi:hypothetical protein